MTDRKFVRVSDRLYEEHSANGSRPLRWAKAPEQLRIELYDVVATRGGDADWKVLYEDEAVTADTSALRPIKQIKAKGKIEDGRGIGFIDTSGACESVLSAITDVEVVLHGATDKQLGAGKTGSLIHMSGDVLKYENRRDLYLALDLRIPQSVFDDAWAEIHSGGAKRIVIAIRVAVFQSEMERSLAEPWMDQVYCIENDSANDAAFGSLVVSTAPIIPQPVGASDDRVESTPDIAAPATEERMVAILANTQTALNRIAGATRILAGGMVAVAILLLIRQF